MKQYRVCLCLLQTLNKACGKVCNSVYLNLDISFLAVSLVDVLWDGIRGDSWRSPSSSTLCPEHGRKSSICTLGKLVLMMSRRTTLDYSHFRTSHTQHMKSHYTTNHSTGTSITFRVLTCVITPKSNTVITIYVHTLLQSFRISPMNRIGDNSLII